MVAVVGVSIHRGDGAAPTSRTSATTVPVPVTAPGGGISLGNGTKVLSEPVDPLSIVVPEGWQSIDAGAPTGAAAVRALVAQAPLMASVLEAEARAAAEGGVRLFAYSPSPGFAFLSVASFASPGAVPSDESAVAAFDAQVKRYKGAVMGVHTVHLPAGHAVQIDSSVVVGKQHVVAQYDILVRPARTVVMRVVAQPATSAPPPYFAQMVNSLRFG